MIVCALNEFSRGFTLKHASCANSQRLARLENTFDGLSEQLSSNEAVLNEVAQSMKANLETLQANIQSVEQRINASSK